MGQPRGVPAYAGEAAGRRAMSDDQNTLGDYEKMSDAEIRQRAKQLRRDVFVHVTPKCEHDFQGWRDFADGRGGETVCTKCGMGAMSWSLRTGI